MSQMKKSTTLKIFLLSSSYATPPPWTHYHGLPPGTSPPRCGFQFCFRAVCLGDRAGLSADPLSSAPLSSAEQSSKENDTQRNEKCAEGPGTQIAQRARLRGVIDDLRTSLEALVWQTKRPGDPRFKVNSRSLPARYPIATYT